MKVVVVEVVVELEEEEVAPAVVNFQVWEVLHIQLVSGRGRG